MRANEEDFDGFYAAVFARLVGQLTLVTGNLHEAEEVVQEALARAVPRWARLRAYDVPEAWVRRVALNLATSHHRQARRRLTALLRLGPPPVVPPVSADALALAESLRALSMPHRQVLVLHHLLGLPVEEVADGYAHQANPPGPAAARRRSRARRRATAVAVTGIIVAGAAAVGLLWPPREPPTPPLQPPQSTAWFKATYLPHGFRFNAAEEYPQELIGLPIPGARSFRGPTRVRGARAEGELTVSVNPQLHTLDVTREARTWPTVRVVGVRGRAGLLLPARPGNFTSGLTWLEHPGVVAQTAGWNLPDAELLRVAEGLRITMARGQPTIEGGALPA